MAQIYQDLQLEEQEVLLVVLPKAMFDLVVSKSNNTLPADRVVGTWNSGIPWLPFPDRIIQKIKK